VLDCGMIWQFLASSALTLVLFVVGLYIWRRQLIAKRRFEVAEQAIAASIGAIEGLSHIRQRMLWAGELAAVEVPKEVTGQDEKQMREQGVYFARARLTEAVFRDLRVAQILAEIHINSETGEAMDEIFIARQEVLGAVNSLYDRGMEEEGLAPEQRTKVREMKVELRRAIAESRDVNGKPEPTDTIAMRLDAAKATIEAACRPFLL
jgi:hypothetical protein